MPAITICVPTFNGEKYLRPCLDSILHQTYGDFELLLVDDCSKDSTLSILDDYKRMDARVRVIRNPRNLGLVGNWNNGIALARGEWIKFAFQDDLLHENCLERMLAAANCPIVFCRRTFLFEDGTDEETIRGYTSIPSISDILGTEPHIEASLVCDAVLREPRNFFGEPTTALLHRSLFERFGYFNTDLAQFCDLEYWIRVSINTGLTYVSEPLAFFRYHASSTSAGNRDPGKDERISIYDRLIIQHEFAHNAHYDPLRRHAANNGFSRNFNRELAKMAVRVQSRAQALANQGEPPDKSWIMRWAELEVRYPHLTRSSWHRIFRARDTWMRYFGWRLN